MSCPNITPPACHKCGKPGHKADKCTEPIPDQPVYCRRCPEAHLASEPCPDGRGPPLKRRRLEDGPKEEGEIMEDGEVVEEDATTGEDEDVDMEEAEDEDERDDVAV